jgi:hypothetical protein
MIKKQAKLTQVNSLCIILELWEEDNLVKKIMKSDSQSNTILNDEIRKKNQLKKWVDWFKQSNSQPELQDENNPIKKNSMLKDLWPGSRDQNNLLWVKSKNDPI